LRRTEGAGDEPPNDILAELETSWVKLNYEAHGNTIPHLHMHFYPRYPGDPFEGGPISAKAVRKPVYAPGEITALRPRLLEALVDRAEG